MSFSRVSAAVAAAGVTLALSAVAYGDPGKSPNGPPGPAGNPNQPAAQPEANAPQAPQGNTGASKGKSDAAPDHKKTTSQGKSNAAHGKSDAAHGKSGSHSATPKKNQANPNPGTPRKGGRADRPAGKITICHATKSVKNPYVEITISVNGLHGHGPAGDSRHHEGSWQDIIPAPAGGCPSAVQQTAGVSTEQKPTTTPTVEPEQQQSQVAAMARPEVAVVAPDAQGVLGVQAAGGSAPAGSTAAAGDAPASGVLGAQAAGSDAPASALAARKANDGTLPFTGFQLAFVLIAAAAALVGGFALRRAAGAGGS